MKNFIRNVFIFISIVIGVIITLPFLGEDKDTSLEYLAASIDKHQRIQNLNTPKIILAGGSNLVFGVDSEKIEQTLKMPVVNLGLHAQLGLSFMLNELKDVTHKGDVIILSIEHSITLKGNHELHTMTSYYNPDVIPYYKEANDSYLKLWLQHRHLLFKNLISKWSGTAKKDPVYSRDAFNRYGDGIKHLELPSHTTLGSRTMITDNKKLEIDALNAFYTFAQKNEITVLFSYGAYAKSEYLKNKEALQVLDKRFKNKLQMNMIASITDFVYPDAYFFDSVYHLNKKGRAIHTRNIINKLTKHFVQKHHTSLH